MVLCVKCSLGDVASWYRAWYGFLAADVRNHSVVRDRLSSALQMMNNCAAERESRRPTPPTDAPPYLPPPPPPPPSTFDEELDSSPPPSDGTNPPDADGPRGRPHIEVQDRPPETFKDLVERRAQQRNLVFIPNGRQFQGKELYVLGKLTLFIERGVCFVSDGRHPNPDWIPTSVTKIFDKAK